ncbi:Phytanoyl-CoA dioxygenase (PhyH) [Dyella sp. OK004]|uniref:phytanoyl-CoA dioxygenase family protein n=1 Tax=Dyella sp. OK004 TaxID=1855292 RepID=UPI0008F05E06|nr:phytanoyl-CoA dioxygenase family protein [Dyella sp. OK004]SFS05889.1 Phytanoyl-CoA dioxygenase (PhyH) [Dyella sp. OK004]
MTSCKPLSNEQMDEFRRNGVLVIPGFYDLPLELLPIQQAIYAVIGQVMKRHGIPDTRPAFTPEHFDVGFQPLIARDRSYGGEVYDAVKQIPAFIRLLADPRHEDLFQSLRPGSIPAVAAGGYGIRIDNPSEDRYRAQWHQEYPAQLRSLDGLVFWSPLIRITPELGPVQFCPGSHTDGPAPVLTKGSDGSGRSGAYALHLKDEESLLSRYPIISPLPSPGDLIVVDFLTLHASGYNRSNRSRWSMQFRYFNFTDPVGMAHGWKGSFAAGVDFRQIHPELCAD